jgi:hypothetical protein
MDKPLNMIGSSLVRFLYTQNPFYLIGTLLVLFGVQQCMGREPSLATSGQLVVVLGVYTLVLAAVAAIVIRCGQVWDDARTILLVIVLLFFMLSTSLDFHLLFTLEAPWPGTMLLAGGFVFSMLVSEAILRGLRIGLAPAYRGPYYLILALLFAYPVALGWMNYHSYYRSVTWALFGFPWAAAAALLTLVPAAQAPPWREPKTGTPWRWPFYPWSLFVYLTIGLAIRSWWLTIAFEPAKGPDAYFRPYFLVPLILAWAMLVLEIGLARRSRGAIAAALMLPLIALVMGFPGPAQNPVETAFLERLVSAIGSPPQIAVAGSLLFYGYAWSRGVRAGEGFALGCGLLASVIGRDTLDWSSFADPNPLVLAAIAGALIALAFQRQSTWRALAAGTLVTAGLGMGGGTFDGDGIQFWRWHAPPLALVAIAVSFNDELARSLRAAAWRVVPALGLIAACVYPWTMPGLEPAAMAGYPALLLVASIGLWLRERRTPLLVATLATLVANLLGHVRQTYILLEQTALAGGLPWLAIGGSVVACAFAISLFKTGIWTAAWQRLEQFNLSLSGGNRPPP